MRQQGAELLLSAGDLSNYLACRHLTELDRAVAEAGERRWFGTIPHWHCSRSAGSLTSWRSSNTSGRAGLV